MQENKPLTVSRKSVDLIVMEEISSRELYDRLHCRPSYPGGDSGVTIGIGYDLGYNTKAQIRADWGGRLKEEVLQVLMACAGATGQKAKDLCAAPAMKTINVPYTEAYKVFIRCSLPRYAKATVVAFPGVELLQPDAAGALVSLVFNRGQRMKDIGQKENKERAREEMRTIATAIYELKESTKLAAENKVDAYQFYDTIARALEGMKRLWDGVPDFDGDKEPRFGGLLRRRDREAALVRGAVRSYADDELIHIPI